MIFAITIDFFKSSGPNFGINQLAGFVISTIIALAVLRKIAVLKAKIWDGLLLLVYLSGILFTGLRSKHHGLAKPSGMLHDLSFSFYDVAINILGFIPIIELSQFIYLAEPLHYQTYYLTD